MNYPAKNVLRLPIITEQVSTYQYKISCVSAEIVNFGDIVESFWSKNPLNTGLLQWRKWLFLRVPKVAKMAIFDSKFGGFQNFQSGNTE